MSVHNSSFLRARDLRKCIHNSTDAPLPCTNNNYCFITVTLFYQILVSPNPLKAYRHALRRLHHITCMHKIMRYGNESSKVLGRTLPAMLECMINYDLNSSCINHCSANQIPIKHCIGES